jgi:hypothetical protein
MDDSNASPTNWLSPWMDVWQYGMQLPMVMSGPFQQLMYTPLGINDQVAVVDAMMEAISRMPLDMAGTVLDALPKKLPSPT